MANDNRPFEEREAGASPPSQLQKDEISPALRAAMWAAIRSVVVRDSREGEWIPDECENLLKAKWVYRNHQMIDDFPRHTVDVIQWAKDDVGQGKWPAFYADIEWLLNMARGTMQDLLRDQVSFALEYTRSPYRIVDDQLVPLGSDQDAETVRTALADTTGAGLDGAKSHLKGAAKNLTDGAWADSVRESIDAVESIAIKLAPGSSELGPALKVLEKGGHLHGAMKSGFSSLYGYASDEHGVRHALLDDGDANVSEADALFMLGACSAFVSYLITKGREAGLLP